MQFTCVYDSGHEYGTGCDSRRYSTKIAADGDTLVIDFEFRDSPHGKSTSGVTANSIRSLTLNITQADALKLASVILAQSLHPRIHGSSVKWIDPEHMPTLEKVRWARSLHAKLTRWKDGVHIINRTQYHIGKVFLSLSYLTCDENGEYFENTREVGRVIDLPPNGSKTVEITDQDAWYADKTGFYEFTGVCVSKVTGIGPDDSF